MMPYTPQHNGTVEQKNQTIVEKARCLLKSSALPMAFWAEAASAAVYLGNISPTEPLPDKTPYEQWTGVKPTVKHLKVFGCLGFVQIPSQRRHKLEDKSEKSIFIGYCLKTKAYKMYNPNTGKVLLSRDVVFREDARWDWGSGNNTRSVYVWDDAFPVEPSCVSPQSNTNQGGENDLQVEQITHSQSSEAAEIPNRAPANHVNTSEDDSPPRRTRQLSDIYSNCSFALLVADPITYEDAAKCVEWQVAMADEMEAINRNETWSLVDKPENKKIIGLKWIFKTKYKASGEILKHKARIVAKGYTQQLGIDVDEVFAPVARMETIRFLFALAAQKGWMLFHLDVKSAFLNGEIAEEVYVEQPTGFEVEG